MGVNGSWSLLDHLYLGNNKSCNKSGISLQTGTFLRNSIAKKKYHTVGTVPKSNRKPYKGKNRYTYRTNKTPLNVLTWYRHFNQKWRG
jgi:hypothetical protein